MFKIFGRKVKSRKVKRKTKPKIKVVKKYKVVKKPIKKIKPKVKIKPKKIIKSKIIKPLIEKMPDEKAFDLLKRYRIQTSPYAFCKNEKELLLAIKKIGFPCVMKVSNGITHKTEVNGVKLNIGNEDEAKRNFNELMKIKGCKKVLIQKMIIEGYEIIVGGKKDLQFGRVVALGAGGIFTEFLKDVSFRVCPLSRNDAEEMLKEVKFSDLILKGFRGQKPADANSIIEVILAVSRIMEKNPKIK